MDAKLLFVQAISPLHAGTGQGVGVIDLPIAREKATGIPFLPGSTLKGVFRDACTDIALRTKIFGPDTGNAELHAGAVTFSDARLVLLPVRSLHGIFAWVTSPLLLHRLKRDAANTPAPISFNVPAPAEGECFVSDPGEKLSMNIGDTKPAVVLEDLPLIFHRSPDVTAWAGWFGTTLYAQDGEMQNALKSRLCIVSDDVLSFLLETATEITARIRIDDNAKTVAEGQLWYEEALPTETVLVSLVVAANVEISKAKSAEVFAAVKALSDNKTLQFGGKATVGRGLCNGWLVG